MLEVGAVKLRNERMVEVLYTSDRMGKNAKSSFPA